MGERWGKDGDEMGMRWGAMVGWGRMEKASIVKRLICCLFFSFCVFILLLVSIVSIVQKFTWARTKQ